MTYRTFKRRIYPFILLGLVIFAALAQHYGWFAAAKEQVVQNQPGLYAIDHFVDGDTIAVKMEGKTESIRMIGVDTPETHKPNSPVQCYGPAAAAYIKNLIGSSQVRLEADPKSTNRDRYNRLLRYVYLPNGRLVAKEAIAGGYGFAYTQFPFTKSEEFIAAQESAHTAAKGLWSNCKPFQQNNGRWQTEDLDTPS